MAECVYNALIVFKQWEQSVSNDAHNKKSQG